tara:strand:+ start:176 stop:334 length:159 start_codon:yes stop_codon:yes gene_type:complete
VISALPKKFYGGVEKKNDTPITSLSLWTLLDEGALFHTLATIRQIQGKQLIL